MHRSKIKYFIFNLILNKINFTTKHTIDNFYKKIKHSGPANFMILAH